MSNYEYDYHTVKQMILRDLETWAPNRPLLEMPSETWMGSPLIYDRTLVSFKGSGPVYEIWKKEFFLDAFVHAHIYKNGNTGTLVAHSALGFQEINP